MSLTLTSRLQLPQWSADSDPAENRADLNAAMLALENNVASITWGLRSAMPAAGVARRFYYAIDAQILYFDNGTVWAPASKGLIAAKQYAPAVLVNYTAAGAVLQAVDATNLTIPFIAPLSGQVLVRLSAMPQATGTGTAVQFGLVTHSTTTLVGVLSSRQTLVGSSAGASSAFAQLISGLTPGQAYQWDWAAIAASTTNPYLGVQGYTTNASSAASAGPAVMEVFSA